MPAELTPTDVAGLDVLPNPCDPRRDLHVFVRYVQEREVKRSHRSNALGKADALRLAKLMSDPEAVAGVQETGGSRWVDFVDWLALKLGFVSYDTKGTYVGYSSSEPSFPDNYVQFNAAKYQQFVQSSLAAQERALIEALIGEREGGQSEFYVTSVLGRLDGFSSWGCATGVVPTLDFVAVRRFLLNLLPQTCTAGEWYSTASLVQHLKVHHPYFLIPQKPRYKDHWGSQQGRYGNFHESKDTWGYEINISESAPDAFERVEGRYVERFLEGLPLTLGYVDVAYAPQPYAGVYPAINHLRALRVNNRLLRALAGDIPPPRVTVQPNFEVYVESEFYPAHVLAQLLPLGELMSADVTTILKLQKERVAAQLAQAGTEGSRSGEQLDVGALLTQLTGRELPQNVAWELAEWGRHAEKFTLYQGFALLEGDADLPAADPFTVERIAPGIRIVHSPAALFARLEAAELVPLQVTHAPASLSRPPAAARTVFVRPAPAVKPTPKEKEPVVLLRHTTIRLHFPTDKLLERVRQALLEVRCPAEVDKANHTLTFSRRHEPQVADVLKALENEYQVQIQDIE
jgi:hypothetical protein